MAGTPRTCCEHVHVHTPMAANEGVRPDQRGLNGFIKLQVRNINISHASMNINDTDADIIKHFLTQFEVLPFQVLQSSSLSASCI